MQLPKNLPQIGDTDDAIVELLKIIATNTGGLGAPVGGDTALTIDESVTVTDPNEDNTGMYFSSGPDWIRFDEDDWRRFEFGFVAHVVNIRFVGDIELAFANPNGGDNRIISLLEAESPFTIGGTPGINSAFLWLRKAESVEQADVKAIAFR